MKSLKCKGVLLGLAVGDKNHGPIQMATMLGESLLNHKKFNSEDYFSLILNWYQNLGTGSDDTGPTCTFVFDEIIKNPKRKVSEVVDEIDKKFKGKTGGVNPAHRGVCLSMYSGISTQELYLLSCEQALLTHKSSYSQLTSFITNYIIRRLIEGVEMEKIINELLKMDSFKTDMIFQTLLKSYSIDIQEKLIPDDGFSPNVLKATLWFVKKYTQGIDLNSEKTDLKKIFRNCLEHSFKFAGKANYCPVLVGAIMGAICGSNNIEEDMYSHCLCTEKVLDVSNQLSKTWE